MDVGVPGFWPHKKNTAGNGTVIDTTNHLLCVGLALETAQSLASETNHHWHMKNINLTSEKWNTTRTYPLVI